MKVKTSELIGDALDWAACLANKQNYVNRETEYATDGRRFQRGTAQPAGPHLSRDWSQGGPIIEQEHIAVWWDGVWHAKYDGCRPDQVQDACTPLIAAMRCYVASKLGDEVDVPEELLP